MYTLHILYMCGYSDINKGYTSFSLEVFVEIISLLTLV